MEAAAKTVESLTQRILPQKPHHLSFDENWRYRPHSGEGKRLDEWNHPRMQYLTLISEGDRGVLLTRSDYDMREELAVKPPPREVNELAKGNGEKKKLSLSDYKNKKTAATSASPPEPSIANKKEVERASDAKTDARFDAGTDAKPDVKVDAKKLERPKPRESDPPIDQKQRQARDIVVDMRLPPKPPTKHPLPPRPPSPAIRKRMADVDEESRPQKRSRPDSGRSLDDRIPMPRDDAQRRKDRAPPHPPARDTSLHKDEKFSNPSSSVLPNGKAVLKSANTSTDTVSSTARPRVESVNGTRTAATGNARPGPNKHEAVHKPSVPPLLSPLHLSFEDRYDGQSSVKVEKKKREDPPPKQKRLEPPLPSTKRQKSPRIPPLLSPTLPPVVEAALQLRNNMSDLPDEQVKEARVPSSKKKKAPADDTDDDEPLQKTQRKSRIVTLKVPDGLRSSFRRLLNLPTSSSRKEAQARDQERAGADETFTNSQARKRPVASAEAGPDATALKKPRGSDTSSNNLRIPAPTTPSKKASAVMSRVSSNNSVVQTPGDTLNATPSNATAVDRRLNGHTALGAESPAAKAMREREQKFSSLGRNLKHEGEKLVQGERRSPGGSGKNREPNPKLGYVLCLESLLAFMASFHAQNLHRAMCNKKSDHSAWASLFPFLEHLEEGIRRLEASRRYLPLYALLLLLRAASIDELIKCYTALDNPGTAVKLEDVLRYERTRTRAWPQIRETNEMIDQPGLRIEITPWATLDEIRLSSIRMLRRWCADEDVDWVPDSILKEPVGK